MQIRSADDLISPAVANAIHERRHELTDEDIAAVRLAQRYAAAIDDGDTDTLAQMGPKLLAVLEQLGATPKARAVIGTRIAAVKDTSGPTTTKLQAIRAAR